MEGLDGLLKCYDHNVSFNSPDEFDQHEAEVPHTYSGTTKCLDCGTKNVPFDSKEKQQPQGGIAGTAVCDDCLEKMREKIARKDAAAAKPKEKQK